MFEVEETTVLMMRKMEGVMDVVMFVALNEWMRVRRAGRYEISAELAAQPMV